ncbi:MAG: RidA family protein [Acidobacteria bacterium]|nr:RidA family protein [Acidobacteriota bacterium]
MKALEAVATAKAPAAIGPYSQAISIGDMVFCSGQLALDPATGALVGTDVSAQTRQIFVNLRAVLEAAGSGLDRVVKTTVFLANMDDFAAMNAVYGDAFGSHKPARSTVEVARLPKNGLVEIEAIALR